MAGGGRTGQSVGSVTVLDSNFTNTEVAIATAHDSTSSPITAGSLILDNVSLVNTPVAVQGPEGTVLAGGTLTISGWGQGHEYTPSGPVNFEAGITLFPRPSSLTIKGKFYTRSKPQYQASPLSQVVSVRTAGAKGNGITDDTLH
jgi:glucan 1,3-beta-glucosidase